MLRNLSQNQCQTEYVEMRPKSVVLQLQKNEAQISGFAVTKK